MTSKIFKSKRFKKLPHSDYWDYYRHKTLPIIIYIGKRSGVLNPFQVHYSQYCQHEEEEKYVNNGEAAELKLSGTVPKNLPSDVELNLLILYKLSK